MECNGLTEAARCALLAELSTEAMLVALQSLSSKVKKRGMSRGRIEHILHARVPIIKFKDAVSGRLCLMPASTKAFSGCPRLGAMAPP